MPMAPLSRAPKHFRLVGRRKLRPFVLPSANEPEPASLTAHSRATFLIFSAGRRGAAGSSGLRPWRLLVEVRSRLVVASRRGRAVSRMGLRHARLHTRTQRADQRDHPRDRARRRCRRELRRGSSCHRRPLCGRSPQRPHGLCRRHPVGAVKRVVPISPLADLEPISLTAMNADLRLDATEIAQESPALLPPRPGVEAHVWVGAQERPAFLWQARLFSEAWSCPWTPESGKHHFDIIDGLTDPTSTLLSVCLG